MTTSNFERPSDMAALTVAVEQMNSHVGVLAQRVEVSAALAEKAVKLDTLTKRLRMAIAGLALCLVLSGFFTYRAVSAANDAKSSATSSRAAATERAKAVCDGFESFTNALIVIGGPSPTPEAQQAQQAKIDAFGVDLGKRLAPLGCELHLIPAP